MAMGKLEGKTVEKFIFWAGKQKDVSTVVEDYINIRRKNEVVQNYGPNPQIDKNINDLCNELGSINH